MGFLCLIGIAHLPEHLDYLEYKDSFEVKPIISTNIARQTEKYLMNPQIVPERAIPIFGNLLHSIKLIASKVLPEIPISGNVKFEDPWALKKEGNQTLSNFDIETGISNKDIMFN